MLGRYYLQSRYYNPAWGRFISADALVSTGQGILGNNMFAYCLNSPTTRIDSVGTLSYRSGVDELDPLALPWENAGGGGGAAGCVAGGGAALIGGCVLSEAIFSDLVDIAKTILSRSKDDIDWNKGDKNHILKGTSGKHVEGWRRFGIDPDNGNDNNWALLIPILQEVIDKADDVWPQINKNGTTCMNYVKTYINEGVKVVVSIWESVDGTLHRISDAIPYIFS